MEITALEFFALCLCWFCCGIAVKGCIDFRRKRSTKGEVTLEGWVTKDKNGKVYLWNKGYDWWCGFGQIVLPESSFPSVTRESEPKKVKITIKAE